MIYCPCDQRATKVAFLIAVVTLIRHSAHCHLFGYLTNNFTFILSSFSFLFFFVIVVVLSDFGDGWVGFIFVSVLGFVLAGFCYHPYK